MFKKGDLVYFNSQGVELFKHISGSVAIIATNSNLIHEYDQGPMVENTQYKVHDVIVCGQLFKDIPEEFLYRITKDEKSTE